MRWTAWHRSRIAAAVGSLSRYCARGLLRGMCCLLCVLRKRRNDHASGSVALTTSHHDGMAPSLGRAMSEHSIELTEQELAVTRAMLCALLAADMGVLATLDDAARDWLQGLLASGASEDIPN